MNKKKIYDSLKHPVVTIDPSLDQYADKTLFPKKLAEANKALKNAKIPKQRPHS